MLSDQSIRVGDACQFGTTVATVEEIGLRATRFRTVQRSVLYIPNGQLATMNVENLGQRDKILFKHVIPVKYGLKPDEMEKLLADLTALLEGDERLDAEARRVHLLRFGAYSLEIELFAFVLTNDWVEFLGIQEDLLLKIMRIVDKHGSDFALPSQTLYVEQGQLPFAPEMKAMEAKPEASGPVQGGA
jgi:MscS family membrane protein